MEQKRNTRRKTIASLLVGASFVFLALNAIGQPNGGNPREVVSIAGLVVEAGSMQPIEGARVVCSKSNNVAVTDKRGYYIIQLAPNRGEFQFSLRIEKDGYKTLSDKEHWGNFSNKEIETRYSKSLIYVSLGKNDGPGKIFVLPETAGETSDALGYENVLAAFELVKDNQQRASKIDSLKKNNQLVFLEVSSEYYIVSRGGHVRISSAEVDGKLIKAKELNARLKRSGIRSLSTAENGSAYKAVITTRAGS